MRTLTEINAAIKSTEQEIENHKDTLSKASRAKRVAEQAIQALKDEMLDVLLADSSKNAGSKGK